MNWFGAGVFLSHVPRLLRWTITKRLNSAKHVTRKILPRTDAVALTALDTQRRLIAGSRRFFVQFWPSNMVPICCPETLVINYQLPPPKIPGELRSSTTSRRTHESSQSFTASERVECACAFKRTDSAERTLGPFMNIWQHTASQIYSASELGTYLSLILCQSTGFDDGNDLFVLFWFMTPFSLVGWNQLRGETWCRH
jgi:hypothetical protein